jgi:hypothetical protein
VKKKGKFQKREDAGVEAKKPFVGIFLFSSQIEIIYSFFFALKSFFKMRYRNRPGNVF